MSDDGTWCMGRDEETKEPVEEEDEEEEEEQDMTNRAGCGVRGPECEDLKTRFPKIRSTQQPKRKCKKKNRRKDDGDVEFCGERTMELLNLPEISATAARMARRDESDDSFTLKQLFQRAIWNAMRNDKMDHLKTIADEAEKAGISSIAKLASTLYTQKTQYPL